VALDALTSQLFDEERDSLIIVRNLGPDRFFTAEQRRRLEHLMADWRSSRDAGRSLPADEQAELEQLIDAELRAATERAAAMSHQRNPKQDESDGVLQDDPHAITHGSRAGLASADDCDKVANKGA
jgi:hypothetical protein